ncbi:hypothetical protein MASR1M104_24390 [Cloacibacterium normanense]
MRAVYSIILLLFFGLFFSQEIKPFDTIKTEKQVVEEIEKANVSTIQKYNPTKAGLYSAVFPALVSTTTRNIGKSQLFGEL